MCARVKDLPYEPPERVNSVADALVSTRPFLLEEMVKAVDDCVVVDEGEIVDAWKRLARTGLLVEHSPVTTASEKVDLEDPVLVLTGSGLKAL